MIESGLAMFGLFCLFVLLIMSIVLLLEWSDTRASTQDLYDLRADLIRRINESHKDK